MSVPTARNQGDLLPDHAYPLGPPEAFASFNALFDHRVQHYPDDPFLSDLTRHLNYSQADKCINTLAKLHGERIVPRRKGEPGKAVGMLWRAGMDYVLHDIALQRLCAGVRHECKMALIVIRRGHIPVAISPSLPPSAIISILRSTEAVALIHGPDQLKSAQAAITDLPGVSLIQVDTHDVPPSDNTTWRTELSPEEESQEVNSIIHTSGSTGDPKIIPMRNRPWLANCCSYPGGPGACLVVTPLSHAYARLALIGTVAYAGRFIVYPPTMPITAPNLMKAIRESKPEMIWVVPTLVKMIAEEPGGIDLLTGLGIVGSAGGPVPTELGDSLVANGVHLVVTLGASEAGNVFSSSRDYDTDRHWEYMRPPTFAIKYMHFESVEDGLAELVVDSKYPSLQMCNRPDGSWASGDLYELHETMKNAWRYFGRRDDLIVHSTGHKTNPIPSRLSPHTPN